jgi:branched-chain amino acid transport system substrate-binding protein
MRLIAAALAIGLTFGAAAQAADTVTIGAIYPLTGPHARLGADAKAAIEIGADIVNTPHKGLDVLPLGAGEGLPAIGGAKIAVTFADDQSNPSVAVSQAMRLNADDRVAALFGAGEDSPTLAATAEAQRRGIPFLVPDAADPMITGRGFAWVFRTTPLAGDVANAYAQFLTGLKAGGMWLDTAALAFENTARGIAAAASLRAAPKAAGLAVVAEIGYAPDGVDLAAPVTALRGKNPDIVVLVSDAADAGLLVKTMRLMDYRPPLLIGDDSGFADPGFVAANGNLAQGVIGRSVWSSGDVDSPAAIVDQLYKAKTGHDLDDTSGRVLQGFLVLAEAINRAGSTDPAVIQKALRETDLKSEQLIVGYNGVKFDASGQNTLASTYLIQLQGKKYVAVWPDGSAAPKLQLPYKAWQQ